MNRFEDIADAIMAVLVTTIVAGVVFYEFCKWIGS